MGGGKPVYIITELMRKGSLQAFLGSECRGGHTSWPVGTGTLPLLMRAFDGAPGLFTEPRSSEAEMAVVGSGQK